MYHMLFSCINDKYFLLNFLEHTYGFKRGFTDDQDKWNCDAEELHIEC